MSITMDPLGLLLIEGKIHWSPRKMFTYITFLFVTSFEGTSLFRGKEHFLWVLKPGFNLHSRDILISTQRWLTAKFVDNFKCSLVTMATAFKTWTIWLENDVLLLWDFNTPHHRNKLIRNFFVHYLDPWNNDCSRFRGRIKIAVLFVG